MKFAEGFARNPNISIDLDENGEYNRMRKASVLLYNLAGKCQVSSPVLCTLVKQSAHPTLLLFCG